MADSLIDKDEQPNRMAPAGYIGTSCRKEQPVKLLVNLSFWALDMATHTQDHYRALFPSAQYSSGLISSLSMSMTARRKPDESLQHHLRPLLIKGDI
jgi:hypothetical protein